VKYKSIILIVDDSILSRKSIENVLSQDEYELRFAGDGFEALRIAEEEAPDLILLDVMMPGIDGFEVCKRIRESTKLEAVPVLMITAMDDRNSRIKGLEVGADDFIAKPFDRTLLKTRVQTITRLNRYRRLMKERTRFEWVIEHANDGYITISQDDVVQYMNSQAATMLGIKDSSTLIGKTLYPYLARRLKCEPHDAWQNWPQSLTSDPNAVRFIIQPESDSLHSKWLQVGCMDVPDDPHEPIVIILKDVSTYINEQRLTWSFHGMMSHKLRTPLNVIKSSVELFSVSDLDPENDTVFRMLKDGVTRLDTEMTEILEFIDTPISSHPADMVNVEDIQATTAQVAASLEVAQHKVFIENLETNTRIPLSKKALRAILTELIGNSKKFHPRSAPSLTVALQCLDENVVIRLIDDGVHLSTEALERAWTPYYQGEKYFTGQMQGMGLGLSNVASIIWEANGKFKINNRNDASGVEVTLSLPIAKRD
jgi:DNA-binding response OmpR family regulator